MRFRLILILGVVLLAGCNGKKEQSQEPVRVVNVPAFNADSAYFFVKKQVDFGPRIPNTEAHKQAGDYFVQTFKSYGAIVQEQKFEATTYDNQKLYLRNIIASFNPEKQKRILLAAHWDTRPFADKNEENPRAEFDGANDGASGVGVLLEMARSFQANGLPDVGVDIILFDGEDWGYDSYTADKLYKKGQQFPLPQGLDSWWCLGSQYWSKKKHVPNYTAYYGILLDMVGAENAVFVKEGTSLLYAPKIVEKVWKTAARLGYSHVFIDKKEYEITDDHLFVNAIGKIPMIDIVHYDHSHGFFGDFHHTHADNMDIISKETLQIVGETMMNVVYYE